MTICGELRFDGRPASAEVARAMLAASAAPAGDAHRCVHVDGALAVATTTGPQRGTVTPGGSVPLVIVDGWTPLGRGEPGAALADAFDRRGPACLDDLPGDWLALLWDRRAATLILARAPLGMLRVLFHTGPARVVFGTEMGQLRAAGVPMGVDEVVLAESLDRAVTAAHETLVRGVHRLPPGELVEARVGARTAARRPFSSLPAIVPPLRGPAVDHAARAVRTALDAALADAVPDGPVGVQLSGGVDSTLVLGLVRGLSRRRRPAARVVPLSMVFPGRPHDESSWIQVALDHFGMRGRCVEPGPYDWDRWRAWTARTMDVPVRPNAAMTAGLLRVARAEGLSVVLTGEGGDDWFTGWAHHFPDLLRAGRWPTLWRQTGPGASLRSVRRRAGRLKHAALALGSGRFGPQRPALPWVRTERARALGLEDRWRAALRADADGYASHDHRGRWSPAAGRASGLSFDAFRLAITVDGVSWRHPLLDPRVVRCALGIAGSTLHSPHLKKQVLRAAAADALPPRIHERRDKARFDGEVVAAVEAAGGPAMLAAGPLVGDGWIDLDAVGRAWAATAAAARDGRVPTDPAHNAVPLWELFSLHTWLMTSGVDT